MSHDVIVAPVLSSESECDVAGIVSLVNGYAAEAIMLYR